MQFKQILYTSDVNQLLLDVDGVTGGFNFQHCWTSGWLAGKAIANSLNSFA